MAGMHLQQISNIERGQCLLPKKHVIPVGKILSCEVELYEAWVKDVFAKFPKLRGKNGRHENRDDRSPGKIAK